MEEVPAGEDVPLHNARTADLMGIPERYCVLNVVSLGMPRSSATPRDLEPKVHREGYGA